MFLSESRVMVTRDRLVLGRRSYALEGVTSVRHEIDPRSRLGPIVILILGLTCLAAAFALQSRATAFAGILLVAIGLFVERNARPRYVVVLGTATNERRVIAGGDKGFALRVVQAVGEAITPGR